MKIKVLKRGTSIVAAVLPAPHARNMAEAGPAVAAGMSFDEVDLPAATRRADIPLLLQRASIKRGKKTVSLAISKKPAKRARPPRKGRKPKK